MMKKSLLLSLLFALSLSVSAQWVTIPDDGFVNRLQQLYPQCMDGNLMNTECESIVYESYLNLSYSDIYNLYGIFHFPNLIELDCSYNNLTSLPELPPYLNTLWCVSNNLTSLPEFSEYLQHLECDNNSLSTLPVLPPFLQVLSCSENEIAILPELPESLTDLICYDNNLTSLPELPTSLIRLWCQNNELSCLPTLPLSLTNGSTGYFNISNNPFTCLPNYVPAMSGPNAQWLSYPLCDLADIVNNPYGCSSFAGILGTVFNDENTNCQNDLAEDGVINVSLSLLDDGGNLVAQTYTFGNSEHTVYNFIAAEGTYTVEMNTVNMPFQASCVDPGTEQNVVLTIPSPSAQNVDFGIECLSGFDVGVQSVVTTGWVFPGQIHTLKIAAGDMPSWYGLQCAQGIGGTVTVYVDGPVSYVEPADNSLTPNVAGDWQFTYDIADFSLVNFQEDFRLLFETDTTAQAGELICVDIIVNPIDDDLHPANNTYNHCYGVVNSYDPNIKQVWPQNVEPGFDGYFNYTIYFQNTGTAPAFNIRLADTLDTNLDLSTFQVTNYSHPVLTYLHGNVLTFRFNNIMLPDSTTDFEGSIGYVQYRIKPIAGLLAGTVIENTAHIFFDFNDAIVTNTTVNEYMIPTSVAGLAKQNSLMLFPNPASGLFTIEWNNHNTQSTIEVFDMNGVRVLQKQSNQNREVMDISTHPAGVYMVRVSNRQNVMQTKLIKR